MIYCRLLTLNPGKVDPSDGQLVEGDPHVVYLL